MKISKYLHSCLVFEKKDFKMLVDPGTFSFAEKEVTPDMFADVKAIVITHNHPDHIDPDNLQKIVAQTHAPVYTTAQVANALAGKDIACATITEGTIEIGPFSIEIMNVLHEPLLDAAPPEMFSIYIDGQVLNPADSFEDKLMKYKGVQLLLLPIMAPFTTEIKVAAFADALQPKEILPIHDGFAKEFFLQQRYQNYKKHFEKQEIKFHVPEKVGDGVTV